MVSSSPYKSFAELSRSEHEGISYRRIVKKRRSGLAIIAPHGGGIEPGTSEIAEAIAGFRFSYYTFDGLKQDGNEILHIQSLLFDEPKCLQLVTDSEIAVTLHGYGGDEKVIHLGGLHDELKTRLINVLVSDGFNARLAVAKYAGTRPDNLCNRARSGRGVQLEISDGLRRTMFKGFDRDGRKFTTDVFEKFIASISKELIAAVREMGIDLDHGLTYFDRSAE